MEMVFEPLRIKSIDLYKLITQWSDRYPVVDEKVPTAVRIDVGSNGDTGFRIEVADVPVLPMICFRDADGSRWIEVQSDRLSCGWSKNENGEYPRYEDLRSEFISIALGFGTFVETATIQVVNLALTYINRFPATDNGGPTAGSTFDLFHAHYDGLPEVDTASVNLVFPYVHDGERYAKMTARSRIDYGRTIPLAKLSLRYGGDPSLGPWSDEVGPFEGFLRFFDHAHESIVEAFARLTDENLHEQWGRQ